MRKDAGDSTGSRGTEVGGKEGGGGQVIADRKRPRRISQSTPRPSVSHQRQTRLLLRKAGAQGTGDHRAKLGAEPCVSYVRSLENICPCLNSTDDWNEGTESQVSYQGHIAGEW